MADKTKVTVTEALAELKTIGKRITKKEQFVGQYLVRQEKFKDALEKDGGSVKALAAEMQAVADLRERVVSIRRAISLANHEVEITLDGVTRSIADWLVWRREVAPGVQQFIATMRQTISTVRNEAVKKGFAFKQSQEQVTEPTDVVVNVDEGWIAKQAEGIEKLLGDLDGQLSLKNATVFVEF